MEPMAGLLFIFTSLTVFFIGCQTLTPARNSPLVKEWIAEYNRLNSLSPSNETCVGFKELTKKEFPLKEFAYLRGSIHCTELLHPEESFSWLNEEWTLAKIEVARAKNNNQDLALHLLARSKQVPLREEKVKLVLEAQKLSKNLDEKLKSEIEEQLYKIAPRFKPTYKPSESLSVARDFLNSRNFSAAKKIYLDVLNGKEFALKEKMKAFQGLARLEKLSRDRTDHVEALKMYVKFLDQSLKKKVNRKHRSLLNKEIKDVEIELARALWTIGRRSEAEKILKARIKEKKKSFSYAIHYWLLGRIEEEKKNSKETLEWLRLSVKEVQEDSALESQSRWFLAWNLFKMEEFKEAIEHLEWFQNDKIEDFTKARALYWVGVSLDRLNEKEKAKNAFEKLSAMDPLGYYGLLAKRELGEPLKKPDAKESKSDSYFFRLKLRGVFTPEWTDWMVSMNERPALKKYLDQVTKDYLKDRSQDDDVWLVLLKSYARSGEYLMLFQKLYTLSPKIRDQLLNDHPELLFPTPHRNEIFEAARRFNIEPELIYSIIRQESAFNPEARSPADAFGLMQLLPKVGEQVGKEIGIEIKDYTDLYLPEKNIPLGAKFIADQRKRHKNNFIATIASYNASDKAIRGWQESRPRPSAVEFIEEIPYEETKSYVRLIIRNYAFYRLFLSSQSETSFPEEVLGTKEWLTPHQSLDNSNVSD